MTTPANGQSSCPVHNASTHGDHSTTNSGQATTHVGNEDTCPVDHTSRSTWSRFFSHAPAASSTPLSTEREVSSIPKAQDGKWVYPSEAQFFSAMQRKNHNPQTADMKTVVPIHNAVNERAWGEILKWEAGRGGDACGGVSLVNFKGKPGERSLKARWRTLLGYVKYEATSFPNSRFFLVTLHPLIAMTGSSIVAVHPCGISLTFTLVTTQGLQTAISRFSSTSGLRLTVGRV